MCLGGAGDAETIRCVLGTFAVHALALWTVGLYGLFKGMSRALLRIGEQRRHLKTA